MKKYYIPILIVIFLLNSSLSCETCYEYPNTKLGDTRNWLPIQGRTSLQFVTDNGSIRSFPIIETDTILKEPYCKKSGYYDYEYLRFEIILDSVLSSSRLEEIVVELKYENEMNINTYEDSLGGASWYRVFTNLGRYRGVTQISNFQLNNRIYSTGILFNTFKNELVIDSIYLAKNFGIVGFKYQKVWYYLP